MNATSIKQHSFIIKCLTYNKTYNGRIINVISVTLFLYRKYFLWDIVNPQLGSRLGLGLGSGLGLELGLELDLGLGLGLGLDYMRGSTISHNMKCLPFILMKPLAKCLDITIMFYNIK